MDNKDEIAENKDYLVGRGFLKLASNLNFEASAKELFGGMQEKLLKIDDYELFTDSPSLNLNKKNKRKTFKKQTVFDRLNQSKRDRGLL